MSVGDRSVQDQSAKFHLKCGRTIWPKSCATHLAPRSGCVFSNLFSCLVDFLSRTCLSTPRDVCGIRGRHAGLARTASSRPDALVLLPDIAIDDLFYEVGTQIVPQRPFRGCTCAPRAVSPSRSRILRVMVGAAHPQVPRDMHPAHLQVCCCSVFAVGFFA